MYSKIIDELKSLADNKFAEWCKPFLSIKDDSQDLILGIRVPILRKLAKKYSNIDIKDLLKLLQNQYHEARALALFIMIIKAKKEPEKMCEIYLDNIAYINNWDLIDYTCPHIVAPNISQTKLLELANSKDLWSNRVAMVSTIYFIKKGDFKNALQFAEKFMTHPHHLMHKAAGWMLREIGKQDIKVLSDFLNKFSAQMPSVMKSYAQEHLRKLKL